MAEIREGDRRPIPVSPRIVRQQAQQTIRNLVDAIVELVTNSDDSYRRLEADGKTPSGKIAIAVNRRKGGEWDYLVISDQAEGMDLERLLTIVTYGEPTSGFEAGRTVRGMFGRGLKEAAIALGAASVRSVKDGKENEVHIVWDESAQTAVREVTKAARPTTDENGATVLIRAGENSLKCPTYETLREQIARHFALRDVNQNKHREVFLSMENVGGGRGRGAGASKRIGRVRYEAADAVTTYRKTVTLTQLGKMTVEVCESERPLDFSPYDPCSEAGLVVKTEGATLDLKLFGYDNYEAGRFFSGAVYCPGIARRVRDGDYGLIDSDRSGLQWKHPACSELYEAVRELLTPHIRRKQRELSSGKKTEVPEKIKKKLANLCALLNRLARQELENVPEEAETNGLRPGEITDLTIKPAVGNGEPKRPRAFSVYLPASLARKGKETIVMVDLQDVMGRVRLLQKGIRLATSMKYPSLLSGRFEVVGDREGDKSYIVAAMDSSEDIAEFQVRKPKEKGRKKKLSGARGGMFRNIEFDAITEKPPQRVYYSNGVVTVYLNFPPLSRYLGAGGKGSDEPQGSLMLAELVSEAFSREVARRKVHERPVAVGGEVDNYNRVVNELMAKHLQLVHKALVV